MNRRDFLRANSSICAGWALSRAVPALADTPSAGKWRTFEVVTKVELLKPDGIGHIWLPAPLIRNTPYQKTISTQFTAKGGTARLSKEGQSALGIVSATYAANAKPTLRMTSRVALKNYAVDLSSRATAPPASQAELDYFLRPSRYVPTDGIVKQTALKETAGATTDIEKARAIYEWVVENTFRDPKVRGCGRGDIRFMLESGDMGGKCADLNALYVGLARSVGLTGAACLWFADCKIRRGLQESWTGDRYRNERTALSRGSLPARAWMGACGSRRRQEGSPGRSSRESSIER